MIRLQNNSLLKELLSRIRSLESPYSYPIQGFLRNVIEEKIPYDTYVDKWPGFQAIITKPKDTQYKSMPMYRVGVYGDSGLIADMLAQPAFIPPHVDARFVGVPVDTLEHYQRACETMGRTLELSVKEPRYFVEYKSLADLKEKYDRMMSDEFYIAPLRCPGDVDFAVKSWRYGQSRYGDTLVETARYLVKHGLPALGAYTKKDDKLVSWVMTDIDRAGMNGHTIDEYRSKGTHTWIMLHLVHALEYEDYPKYGYIPVNNQTSLRNAEFLGAKLYPKKVWHFVIKAKTDSKL